ncbi:carbohydrate ABC transporter substrate-binding protein (CUT1 family) [Bacillus oleivorans]|uniref:Carbohydrate ABC transporter substrate-binding protein (CUT1 family) n=1 Tax=Bacillus oleivorans TaxID=1448271 RepID=A0A285CHP4_9BACI|nr:extracellular solute-binding protein [Bacillus oleivorans]SNX67122.1 carbohydrate ABC transporter substrate-binding protein (CUT1 family) [Bacillus oleivorans]
MFGKQKNHWFRIILGLSFVLLFVAGCNSEDANQEEDNGENAEIVFWHYLNDRHELLKGFAEDFETETGTKVDVQLFGGDGFKQKIIAAAQTDSLPDLMTYSGGAGDLAQLVETDSVLELSSELGDLFNKFPDTLVKTFSFAEGNPHKVTKYGTYAVPMDANNMQFIYNTDLFAEAGISEAPKTWDEFIEAIDKLNEAGITPFATGMGSWVIDPILNPYEFAYLGQEQLFKIKQGEEPIIGSDYIKVLELFEEMYEHDAFAEGIATMDLPAAEQMFVNGEVAMIFDGSWGIGVFNQMNPEFKNYDVFMPPVPSDAKYDIKITGGIGVPLVVSNDTEYKEETLEFVKYLVAKEQQQEYAEKSFNLPANLEAAQSEDGMSSALRNFSLGMEHVFESPGVYKNPNASTVLQKGIQLIVIGEATPEEVLEDLAAEIEKGE